MLLHLWYIPYYYKENLRPKKLDTPHLPKKTKIFVVRSEILIKHKRIKWTPNRKALHLLPGG